MEVVLQKMVKRESQPTPNMEVKTGIVTHFSVLPDDDGSRALRVRGCLGERVSVFHFCECRLRGRVARLTIRLESVLCLLKVTIIGEGERDSRVLRVEEWSIIVHRVGETLRDNNFGSVLVSVLATSQGRL